MEAFTYKLNKHHDERGYFEVLFSSNLWRNKTAAQVSSSRSKKNVLRGIHVAPFFKIVTCVYGKIFDVAVNPKDGKWLSAELSPENSELMFIPPNWGHGFLALEESIIVYSQGGTYNPKLEKAIRWDSLGINWPATENLIISEKDRNA